MEEKINLFFRNYVCIPIGRWLAKKGVPPNNITLFGLFLSVAAALLTVIFGLFVGAFAVAVSALPDAFDGEVARAGNNTTNFGSFLDDVTDRFGESFYFIAIYLLQASLAVLVAGISSILVSYSKASAGRWGFELSSGKAMGRPGRIILLAVLMLASPWLAISQTLWLVVALNLFIFFKRFYEVYRQKD